MLTGLPRPRPDLDTQMFWDACSEGRFLVPECGDCKHRRWPPGPMCPACQSERTNWIKSSGRGRIYSWVVVTHPVDAILVDQVPYAIAMVELEEGVRVVGNVTDCPPDAIVADMEVVLHFEEPNEDGIRIPNFHRANDHE